MAESKRPRKKANASTNKKTNKTDKKKSPKPEVKKPKPWWKSLFSCTSDAIDDVEEADDVVHFFSLYLELPLYFTRFVHRRIPKKKRTKKKNTHLHRLHLCQQTENREVCVSLSIWMAKMMSLYQVGDLVALSDRRDPCTCNQHPS